VDGNRQVVDPVFDEALVFEAELDFRRSFVAAAGEGIDFAVEVKLDPLFGFAGTKEPKGGGSQGEDGTDAADDLDPVLEGFERKFREHAFASYAIR
jgi:hypothetical protein